MRGWRSEIRWNNIESKLPVQVERKLALGEDEGAQRPMEPPKNATPLTHRRFLPRLLRTSAFRYTMAFFVLFMGCFVGIGYFVFASTLGNTMKRLDAELFNELQYFAALNSRFGPDGMAGLRAVEAEVARLKVVQKDALYVIVLGIEDRPYRVLTSDIEGFPDEAVTADGMFEFEYDAKVIDRDTGSARTITRPAVGRRGNFLYRGVDGEEVRAIIITARDISEVKEIRESALSNVVRIAGFGAVLAFGLGAFYSGNFLRRVDQIGQTVKAIRDGDLTKRIALDGSNDEFETLSDNINAMLDQIERLMTGMRQVSDNIAHDLRSPLTRIKARLESALSDGDADEREVLETTAIDVERLLATFNALLSITRIESGEGGGNKVAVDVAAVADEMLELYEPAAADAGFALVGNITPAPSVMGSRELISQAIANLLDNALKYAQWPEGQVEGQSGTQQEAVTPTIELTVGPRPGGGVLLSVMDNGPGVSEADQERILQRFVRLERSRSTTGNGLGLSLVSAIAQRHGAQISIGRGLSHHPQERALSKPSAYGLGIRIAFPASAKPVKNSLATAAERTSPQGPGGNPASA
ncbi:MAG: HAMP domain-containing sensor histidine kinase [Pseudomonadota bacterium]